MTSPRSRSKAAAGFTLVELLTVMALLALLFGIVVVSLTGGSEGSRLRMAATEVRSAIRFARQHAIANSTYCSVVFAFDPTPSTGVELKDPNAKVNLSGLYSSSRPINQTRIMRAYAIYSARAREGSGGLITDWKYLPPGLIFDNQQERTNTGRLNPLWHKACRTVVPLSTFSFEMNKPVSAQNPNTKDDENLMIRAQAITFKPDGSLKFDGVDQNSSIQMTLFIAEGVNNGESNPESKDVIYTYKEPDPTKRQSVALDVFAFTGEVLMSMKEQFGK